MVQAITIAHFLYGNDTKGLERGFREPKVLEQLLSRDSNYWTKIIQKFDFQKIGCLFFN